ncbi:carbohydrate ABC transporter permease [Parasphaerochaeta coccoides]|uniref:sn-glycerol-3-phosphate transport system permease protein UgpE n=1 Tax=Parasphaerochaeta coccoides (strain ATCC BAA-1237 / DSM 17374 / SPN1) TaxID=760011 RepID=F4GI20_PARC1|nr:carbohydrate ABC transporter permease [Parasphaerochaeta coccoides]AEC02618.1 binding-protein-dependent transport systems inner membrane component [Parasphaerochaeta coccoides DSM 17374]
MKFTYDMVRRHRKAQDIALGASAAILGIIVVFPILYTISASLFRMSDFAQWPPRLWTSSPSWDNYLRVFRNSLMVRYVYNSLGTALIGTIFRGAISILAGYAAAVLSFRGRDFLFVFILATMLVPSDALLIENYLTVMRLGWTNTWVGILSIQILAPVNMLMYRQYFKTIPREYREVAMISGCGDFGYLRMIVLPISMPIVLTLSLQSFISIWNSYLWPLLVTTDQNMRTVQVGITMLGFSESLDYGPLFAALAVIMVPSIVIFALLRKRIMDGILGNITTTL